MNVDSTKLGVGITGRLFVFDYGPSPVEVDARSNEYFRTFMAWLMRSWAGAAEKLSLNTNHLGQVRVQFHLSSDGSISDLRMLANTAGELAGRACRKALQNGKAFEAWPSEMCRNLNAGYFTIRACFDYEPEPLTSGELEIAKTLASLRPSYVSNELAKAFGSFQTDPSYLTQGFARIQTNDYSGAMVEFSRALSWDRRDAWAFNGRGYCRYRLEDFEGARRDLDRAIELDPQNPSSWRHRGLVRMNLDDYLGAIQDCTRAIELLAQYSQAYAVRAEAGMRLRDFPHALADINRAIEIDPTRAIDFCTRGFIEFDLGDFTQAMADSKRAMALNPKRASAYELLGYIHVASTNYVAAMGNFRKSLDIVGEYNYSRFQLWALRWRSGEGEQATKELARHFKSCKKHPSNAWFCSLEAFLVGALSEKALLKVARTSGKSREVRQEQLCEAMYYAGLKRILAGESHAAWELFRRCLSTGQSNACEFMLATQELKRLEQR